MKGDDCARVTYDGCGLLSMGSVTAVVRGSGSIFQVQHPIFV